MSKRTIKSLIPVYWPDDSIIYTALCNDGSLFEIVVDGSGDCGEGWKEINLPPIPQPEKKVPRGTNQQKPLLESKFEQWWKLYPRKTAKKVAQAAWDKAGLDARAGSLIAILERQKAAGMLKNDQYTPHGATYLNQERWRDQPVEAEPQQSSDWMKTDNGIISKGRELGLEAKPGETMQQFKGRVMAKAGVAR